MTSRRLAWFWWLAAALATGLVVAGQLSTPPGTDVAWNLYAGREVLAGARVGVDILENTPPMIFWLEAPPLWLAARLGTDPWPMWALWIGGLATLTGLMSAVLAPSSLPRAVRGAAAPAVIGMLLVAPGRDFGQREHVTIALVLPIVLVMARRLGREPVSRWLAGATGLLAALGIGMKPFFVLVWAGLLFLLVLRQGASAARQVEHLTIVGSGVAYIAAVAVLAPGYFGYAADYGPLYQRFLALRPWEMMVVRDGISMVPALTALGLFWALRGHLEQTSQRVCDVLAVACAAFLVVAFLQAKGWPYHFLPSIVVAGLLIAMILATAQPAGGLVGGAYRVAGAVILAGLLTTGLWDAAKRAVWPADPDHLDDHNTRALLPVVASIPAGETLAVLSTNVASGWPLTLVARRRWAFRFPSLWPLAALYHDQIRAGGAIRYRELTGASDLERRFVEAVENDLLRARPALILVPRPAPEVAGWGGARRFDYLEWVRRAPRLGDRWLAGYRREPDVGDYLVLRRADTR